MLDKVKKVYTISHVDGRFGPLQQWDLYVGATVNLLGRKMTLMQASGSTLVWLESKRKSLQRVCKDLENELCKYEPSMSKARMRGKRGGSRGRSEKKGSANLRCMINQADKMRRTLAKYRPRLAAKIVKGMPI